MSLLWKLLPPNIEKLKQNHDTSGLLRVVRSLPDAALRQAAVEALGEVGDEMTALVLIRELQERPPESTDRWDAAILKIISRRGMEALKTLRNEVDRNGPVGQVIEAVFLRTSPASVDVLFHCFEEAARRTAGYFTPVYSLAVEALFKMNRVEAVDALMRIDLAGYTRLSQLYLHNRLLEVKLPPDCAPRLLSGLKSMNYEERELSATLLLTNPSLLDEATLASLDGEQRALLAIVGRKWDALVALGAEAMGGIDQHWYSLARDNLARIAPLVAQFGGPVYADRLLGLLEPSLSRGRADDVREVNEVRRRQELLLPVVQRNADGLSVDTLQKLAQLPDELRLRYRASKAYEETDDPGATKYYEVEEEAVIEFGAVKQIAVTSLANRAGAQ